MFLVERGLLARSCGDVIQMLMLNERGVELSFAVD